MALSISTLTSSVWNLAEKRSMYCFVLFSSLNRSCKSSGTYLDWVWLGRGHIPEPTTAARGHSLCTEPGLSHVQTLETSSAPFSIPNTHTPTHPHQRPLLTLQMIK